MTIYYDDPKDIEHQRTKEQAKDLRMHGLMEESFGSTALITGLVAHNYNHIVRETPSKGLRWFGSLANLFGIFEIVKSLFTASKAHDLELKVARTVEPQHVLLTQTPPPGSGIAILPETMVQTAPSCGCDHKPKFLETIQPQSLQDHAGKPFIVERS